MSFLAQGSRIVLFWGGAGPTVRGSKAGKLCSSSNGSSRFIDFGWFPAADVWRTGGAKLLAYQKKMFHTLSEFHACKSLSKFEATINKSEFLVRAWVWLREVLCVTCDDYLIVPLESQFLNNKAGNANDRHSAESTENMLKHSKPALDGWEGSGSWVGCLERLSF